MKRGRDDNAFVWLDGMTRADMFACLDTLLAHWAGTSTMKTSTADAEAKGYRLVYLPPGISVATARMLRE